MTTNWKEMLENKEMVRNAVNFGLGLTSGENFRLYSSILGYGGPARELVRQGVVRARERTRKALKRRAILNKFNLVQN